MATVSVELGSMLCDVLTSMLVHLIGSPKSLACEKFAAESWTRFKDIPALKSPDFSFIRGTVSKVDSASKIAHILDSETQQNRMENYDYLIAASGLRRIFPVAPQSVRREDFLEEAKKHVEDVRNASQGIVVVGGGLYRNGTSREKSLIR